MFEDVKDVKKVDGVNKKENLEFQEQSIIESSQKKRSMFLAETLKSSVEKVLGIYDSPVTQKIIKLMIPYVNDAVTGINLYRGKEGGKAFSRRQYFIYSTGIVIDVASLALLCSGKFGEAINVHLIAQSLIKGETCLKLIKLAVEKVRETSSQLADILEAGHQLILNEKDLLPELSSVLKNFTNMGLEL